MSNHFIPYGKQNITDDEVNAVVEALKHPFLTQGPKVDEFERAICNYTGARYCVAVTNGTAALHLATLALELPKSSVGITSANTFVASPNSMIYAGLKPKILDIDPQTNNLSLDLLEKKITRNTKLIMPVLFAGLSLDMKRLSKIAKASKCKVIEDASHALGSSYESGEKVGSCRYSDMTTFSFHPVKTITTGEGGAITTNSKKLYEKLLSLRTHGIIKSKKWADKKPWYYEMRDLGFNYRLTDIQAALGLTQMSRLDEFVNRRREIVEKYNNALKEIDLIKSCDSNFHTKRTSYHLFVARFSFKKMKMTRGQVMKWLSERGVGTQVHYIPIYLQPFYKEKFALKVNNFPHMNSFYDEALSLPLYPGMEDSDVDKVIDLLGELVKKCIKR